MHMECVSGWMWKMKNGEKKNDNNNNKGRCVQMCLMVIVYIYILAIMESCCVWVMFGEKKKLESERIGFINKRK